MAHWTQNKYPEYRDVTERQTFVRDLYTGRALNEARDRAEELAEDDLSDLQRDEEYEGRDQYFREPELGQYLFKRAQGENAQAFYERARISRQPMHFAQVVDRSVGAVQLAGYNKNQWADDGEGPLGDPIEDESMAARIQQDVTGDGVSWHSFVTEALTRMMLNSDPRHKRAGVYVLVDGPTEDTSRPTAHIIRLPAIMDTYSENGRLTDVVVQEQVSGRDGITEQHGSEQHYIHYHTEGYDRYDGEGNQMPDRSGDWENPFYATPEQEQRILPIFRVQMGLPRDVVNQMAEGEQYLFNLLSDIRMAGRIASFPRLVGDVDDAEFNNTMDALVRGQNVLQGDWNYEILDWGALKQAREMYHAEAKEYYESSFQQLNDAARESTATEIRQRDQNGRQAFLQHLSGKADQIDNQLRYLFAQYEAPGQPEQWVIPEAERSTDYSPSDPHAESQKLKDLYFPTGPVPASRGAKKEAALKISEMQGIPEQDDDGLDAAIAVGSGRPSDQRIAQLQETVANATTNGEA